MRWLGLFNPELTWTFKLTRSVLRDLKLHGHFRSAAGINSLSDIIYLYGELDHCTFLTYIYLMKGRGHEIQCLSCLVLVFFFPSLCFVRASGTKCGGGCLRVTWSFWTLGGQEQYKCEGKADSCHHWSQAGDPPSLQQLQKAVKIPSIGYAWAFGFWFLF